MRPLYDQVRSELEGITESAETYVQSEDSAVAEFVSDMFYGEVSADQLQFSELSSEAADAVKTLIKRYPKNWRTKLREYCELEHIDSIYRRDGEILSSGPIGEQEHQIDSSMALVKQINELDPSDFERIKREFLGSSSKQGDRDFWFYTVHDYERWSLILDEERICVDFGAPVRKAVSRE